MESNKLDTLSHHKLKAIISNVINSLMNILILYRKVHYLQDGRAVANKGEPKWTTREGGGDKTSWTTGEGEGANIFERVGGTNKLGLGQYFKFLKPDF